MSITATLEKSADIAFNLIDEAWIKVLTPECEIREVSIKEALLSAQNFNDLSGELSTQNVAVLRLLLAIVFTVFSRADENGNEYEERDEESLLSCWSAIWKSGKLPEKPISDYLSAHHDDFWLFHPTRPFGQTPKAAIGTEYEVSKLIGELSESNNKRRLFLSRMQNSIVFSEAARWLLFQNAYADTSARKKDDDTSSRKELNKISVSWLGQFSVIYAIGDNLFETIMLNLVMTRENYESWNEAKPNWEIDIPRYKQRVEINVPQDYASLLTLQSRRMILLNNDSSVFGFHVLGGDYFNKTNAFSEQMCAWKRTDKKHPNEFAPLWSNNSRQMWRDFNQYFNYNRSSKENIPLPGVVLWINRLICDNIINKMKTITFLSTTVEYNTSQKSAISDVSGDSLTFHTDMFTEIGKAAQTRVEEEIVKCDELAQAVGLLAADLDRAAGGDGGVSVKAKERFYYLIDNPFRTWLAGLEPNCARDKLENNITQWQTTAEKIAKKLGNELVSEAGTAAFIGREVVKDKKSTFYSSSNAQKYFIWNVNKVYKK